MKHLAGKAYALVAAFAYCLISATSIGLLINM